MSNTATGSKQAIHDLETVAKKADLVETTAIIRDKKGKEYKLHLEQTDWWVRGHALEAGEMHPDMSVNVKVPNADRKFLQRIYQGYGRQTGMTLSGEVYTFSQAMICLATGLPDAELVVDSITAKSKRCSLKPSELKQACVAAWCEAFGIDVPSAKELKTAKASSKNLAEDKRAEVEKLIRSGVNGIKEWNDKWPEKPKRALDLTGLKLANADLKSLNLSGLNVSGSDFSSSDLSGADFQGATLKKCNFNNCKLHNVKMYYAEVEGSTFENVEIRGGTMPMFRNSRVNARFFDIDFRNGDLRGADLTGSTFNNCKFENAQFDQNTKFPDNFDSMDKLAWKGQGIDPRKVKAFHESNADEGLDFETFIERLGKGMDKERIKKSLSMLKKDRFQLFSDVKNDSVTGIVKSQTDKDLVYSCRLTSDGHFSCCTQNLNVCGGLRGALCKHILVLLLGLTRANELNANKADLWARASALQKPQLDKEIASETFLRFKGAEAGEIDWRPTETTPEDFYAF